MWFSSSHLFVRTYFCYFQHLNDFDHLISFCVVVVVVLLDVMWIWHTLALAQSSKRTSSNATKNVRKPMKRLDQFVHPMAMYIVHYVKWKRKRVAVVWFQCHWKIVQQLPFVIPIVMRMRPQIQPVSFVVQIINFIAANAICAKNIAVNIYSLYRWNVVWPHSHLKDALECVHRIMVCKFSFHRKRFGHFLTILIHFCRPCMRLRQ